MVTLPNPGRRAIDKMSRQPSSLKLKDPGKRVFSTSASQIQIFFRERADTFEHERKRAGYILLLLIPGVPVHSVQFDPTWEGPSPLARRRDCT